MNNMSNEIDEIIKNKNIGNLKCEETNEKITKIMKIIDEKIFRIKENDNTCINKCTQSSNINKNLLVEIIKKKGKYFEMLLKQYLIIKIIEKYEKNDETLHIIKKMIECKDNNNDNMLMICLKKYMIELFNKIMYDYKECIDINEKNRYNQTILNLILSKRYSTLQKKKINLIINIYGKELETNDNIINKIIRYGERTRYKNSYILKRIVNETNYKFEGKIKKNKTYIKIVYDYFTNEQKTTMLEYCIWPDIKKKIICEKIQNIENENKETIMICIRKIINEDIKIDIDIEGKYKIKLSELKNIIKNEENIKRVINIIKINIIKIKDIEDLSLILKYTSSSGKINEFLNKRQERIKNIILNEINILNNNIYADNKKLIVLLKKIRRKKNAINLVIKIILEKYDWKNKELNECLKNIYNSIVKSINDRNIRQCRNKLNKRNFIKYTNKLRELYDDIDYSYVLTQYIRKIIWFAANDTHSYLQKKKNEKIVNKIIHLIKNNTNKKTKEWIIDNYSILIDDIYRYKNNYEDNIMLILSEEIIRMFKFKKKIKIILRILEEKKLYRVYEKIIDVLSKCNLNGEEKIFLINKTLNNKSIFNSIYEYENKYEIVNKILQIK